MYCLKDVLLTIDFKIRREYQFKIPFLTDTLIFVLRGLRFSNQGLKVFFDKKRISFSFFNHFSIPGEVFLLSLNTIVENRLF